MKIDFVDFWSINRWLCQYDIVIEDDCRWVNEARIIHPLAETPYRSTDIFKYWNPTKLHQYLLMLDSWTADVCSFEQYWSSGEPLPALEFKLFPCPDGRYYAGYPAIDPKYYVAAFDFSPRLCSNKRCPKERNEETQKIWLDRGQYQIANAAKSLWSCVNREQKNG